MSEEDKSQNDSIAAAVSAAMAKPAEPSVQAEAPVASQQVSGGNVMQAMFLKDLVVPSPKRVLVWFAEDPSTLLMVMKLSRDIGSQETFVGVTDNVLIPIATKLAPRLDKLFSLDESARASVFSTVDEQQLVKKICERALSAPKARGVVGVQGVSGLQINPRNVMDAVEFFGSTVLPILMMFLKRRQGG